MKASNVMIKSWLSGNHQKIQDIHLSFGCMIMAIIFCPGCHHEIDSLCLICPLCGEKTPTSRFQDEYVENKEHGHGLQFMIIIMLLILLAWLSVQLIESWRFGS